MELNDQQRKSSVTCRSHSCSTRQPGTGKTRVLACRVAHILKQAPPKARRYSA